MHIVGHHLQITAVNRPLPAEKDLFARSAYNRYYYASFLEARKAFAQMDKAWSTMAHKSYPGTLRGTIARDFKRERGKANKSGDFTLENQLRGASDAALGLATILERAYGTRVTADYEDTPVFFEQGGRFSLNNITVTEAHGWHSNVQQLTSVILMAWKQIHG